MLIRVSLAIETWVDSLAWERATSPAAPDRRIGRTDGLDRASPGYFAKKNPQSLMKSTRGPGPLSPPFPYPLPTLLSGGGRIRRRCRPRARCGSGRARPDAAAGGSVGCRRAAGWPGATSRPLSFPLFPYKPGQARRAGRRPSLPSRRARRRPSLPSRGLPCAPASSHVAVKAGVCSRPRSAVRPGSSLVAGHAEADASRPWRFRSPSPRPVQLDGVRGRPGLIYVCS